MKKSLLILLLFLFGMSFRASTQDFSPYFLPDQHSKYLEYLVNSGKMNVDHVLSQPYTADELLDGLPDLPEAYQQHWLKLLGKDLEKFSSPSDTTNKYGKLIASVDGGIRLSQENDDFNKRLFGSAFVSYGYRNFGIFHRFEADESYKYDTLYFGTSGKNQNPVFTRASDSYLKWNAKNLSFFIGRLNRNFGMINEPGLLISDNPFSYDHAGLEFSNGIFKFTTFFTRLEDIYGYDIRDSIQNIAWNKRYLSMHRFEFSILKNLEFAFSETILYGGENQDIQFQYVNPANIYFFSKMSDRKGYEEQDANALMSFEAYYKPVKKLTLFAQFLIDDIDFKKELRDINPDRLGISSKIIWSDPFPGSQVYITYNRINNWTYNSFYTWGNYTFYGKSLGYPKHGAENVSLGMDCFRFSPVMASLQFKWERERSQDLQSPFIAEKTEFPIGIAQQSVSADINITYFPKTYLTASLDMQYIQYSNFGHVDGIEKGFFNIMFKLKATGILRLLDR